MARKSRKGRTDKPSSGGRASGKGRTDKRAGGTRALRRLSEDLVELRFEPKSSRREYLGVVLMSFGALALGAGVYAMFLIESAELAAYGKWMLAAGVVLMAAYLLLGQRSLAAVHVGDLGVGIETEGKVTRTNWWEMRSVGLAHDMLRVKTDHKPLTLSLTAHREAVRRLVSEALKRVPKRVELDDEDLHRIGKPKSGHGIEVTVDPPQVTSLTCSATDRPLTFEKDVRMCARCGALYHRAGVPRRCVECGKKLKR